MRFVTELPGQLKMMDNFYLVMIRKVKLVNLVCGLLALQHDAPTRKELLMPQGAVFVLCYQQWGPLNAKVVMGKSKCTYSGMKNCVGQ